MPTRALRGPLTGLLVLLLACGCAPEAKDHYTGYVEGEFLYLASSRAGRVVELLVAEGDTVQEGQVLFRLDPEPEAHEVQQAELRVEQARARLADLLKGARPSEIEALDARLLAVRSDLERARRDAERREELGAEDARAVSEEERDRARTAVLTLEAEVARLQAERETLLLGGREDAQRAAELEVQALEAQLQQQRWNLEQKTVRAPAAGHVQLLLQRVGEQVPAGRPVLSLLPPENLEVRFYVPQADLPGLALDQSVRVRADGLGTDVGARVGFLADRVEFTPPVIYSQASRDELVVLVKARPSPADAARLRVGQPVEVRVD